MISIMSPGEGYFFLTNNFQDDIPTKNIEAMYEAAAKKNNFILM